MDDTISTVGQGTGKKREQKPKRDERKVLRAEKSRVFRNLRWAFPLLIAIAMFIIGRYRFPALSAVGASAPHPVNRLLLALYYGDFDFFAPLLATLIFADSYVIDFEQGFVRFIVQRTRFKKYLNSKMLAVALAGGLSIVLVMVVIFICGLTQGLDFSPKPYISGKSASGPDGPFSDLYMVQPLFYLIYLLLSGFLWGVGWSLLGLAVSSLLPNRYVALAAPLVIAQVLSYAGAWSWRLPLILDPYISLMPFILYFPTTYGLEIQIAQYSFLILFSWLILRLTSKKIRQSI